VDAACELSSRLDSCQWVDTKGEDGGMGVRDCLVRRLFACDPFLSGKLSARCNWPWQIGFGAPLVQPNGRDANNPTAPHDF
jgi:hypothetical protein